MGLSFFSKESWYNSTKAIQYLEIRTASCEPHKELGASLPDILILIVTTGLTLGLEHCVGLVGLHLPDWALLGLRPPPWWWLSCLFHRQHVLHHSRLAGYFLYLFHTLIVGVALLVRLCDAVQLVGLLDGTAVDWAAGWFSQLQGILGIE